VIRGALAAIATALAAMGCAQTGTANVEPAYRPADKGLLVASLTASGHNPGTLSFQVVPLSAPAETAAAIAVNDETLGMDWRLGDLDVQNGGYGRLAVVELAPGDYEVRRGLLRVSALETYTSVRRYGFRFTIVPGKATYLGNVHVDMRRSPEGALLAATQLVDRRARDLALLHRKYTSIKPEQVVFPDDLEHEAVLKRASEGAPAKLEDLERLLPRK
jgi:hypothetical protein